MTISKSISVVVPMFNASETILRSISSIFQQSFLPTEVIVVDDGSTDRSSMKIERYFPKVRVIRQINAGAGSARNTGITEAKGDWIAFLDADDFWLPNHLKVVSKLIQDFPQSSFIATASQQWHPTQPLSVKQKAIKTGVVDYFEEQSLKLGVVNSSTAAVERSVFNQIGMFKNIKLGEDLDMWERISLGYTFVRTTEITSVYVNTQSGQMSEFNRNLLVSGEIASGIPYLSENVEVQINSHNFKKTNVYQNHLRCINVKRFLFVGDLTSAKKLVYRNAGPSRIRHRYFLFIVKYCPAWLLMHLVRSGKNFKKLLKKRRI